MVKEICWGLRLVCRVGEGVCWRVEGGLLGGWRGLLGANGGVCRGE